MEEVTFEVIVKGPWLGKDGVNMEMRPQAKAKKRKVVSICVKYSGLARAMLLKLPVRGNHLWILSKCILLFNTPDGVQL